MKRVLIHYVVYLLVISSFGTVVGNATAQTTQTLYEKKCGRCHKAYDPSDYSAEEWPGLVRTMKSQAALTSNEITEIVEYLRIESDEVGGEKLVQGPVVGGYLYTEYFQTPEETKNYDIHYLAVSIAGWANENIQYFGEFELEHGGKDDNVFVEQAYVDYWLWPTLAVKVGAILTPFNRFDEFHDPLNNYLVTRPQVSREIGVSAWKDVGADLHGYVNVTDGTAFTFDLYTINGLGSGATLRSSRQYRDNNEHKAFGGRANIIVVDMLEIGTSAYHGAWDNNANYTLEMFGGHCLLNTRLVDFYGELAWAKSENPGDTEDGDMRGYFVQASRLFDGKYRPTIRLGGLDYLDEGALLGRNPIKGDKELTELALGFAYYPISKVVFKIEFSFFDEGGRVVKRDNDQLGLQAAVKF